MAENGIINEYLTRNFSRTGKGICVSNLDRNLKYDNNSAEKLIGHSKPDRNKESGRHYNTHNLHMEDLKGEGNLTWPDPEHDQGQQANGIAC